MASTSHRFFRRSEPVVMDKRHPFAAVFDQLVQLNELPVITIPTTEEDTRLENNEDNPMSKTKKPKPKATTNMRDEVHEITKPAIRLRNADFLELFQQTMNPAASAPASASTPTPVSASAPSSTPVSTHANSNAATGEEIENDD